MDYKVKINGKEYTLPVRTIAVDEKMSRLAALGKRCKTGEITRREVMEGQYRFVEEMAPGAFPDLETADVNMMLKACMDIVAVYAAPSLEGQRMFILTVVQIFPSWMFCGGRNKPFQYPILVYWDIGAIDFSHPLIMCVGGSVTDALRANIHVLVQHTAVHWDIGRTVGM